MEACWSWLYYHFLAPKGAVLGLKLKASSSFWFLLGFLGQKYSLDVGQNTSLCNCDTGEQFVQLLVVAHSQLKMTGDDSRLLVVTSSVARQLEDLSAEIFKNSSQVDWSTGANALSIVAFAKKTVDTTNWELKPCSGWAGLWFGALCLSFTATRHVYED